MTFANVPTRTYRLLSNFHLHCENNIYGNIIHNNIRPEPNSITNDKFHYKNGIIIKFEGAIT